MNNPLYISEDTTAFADRAFVDSLSPAEGMRYTYIDLENITEEQRGKLSEAEKEMAKKPGILGIVNMSMMHQADVSTRNGTVYPAHVLSREVAALNNNKVIHNGAYMAADHPDWREGWRVKFSNSASYLTKLEYDAATGVVSGAAVIIDKPSGRDVAMTFKAGGNVGVSSRGCGSARQGDINGLHGPVSGRILQDDFILEGFDFVLDPSVRGAGVDSMTEENHGEVKMNKDTLKKDHPEVFDAVFADGKQAALEDLTGDDGKFVSTDLYNETKASLESAESKCGELSTAATEHETKIKALEESKAAVDGEIAELRTSVEENKVAADRSAAEAFVSEALASHPHRDAIRSRFAESDTANVESAKVALEAAQKFLDALGIPASPINLEEVNRAGKAPEVIEEPENVTEETSSAMSKLYAMSGMSFDK